MNPDDVCWEAFGFPTPCLMPCRTPAEGLWKAISERELPFKTRWDFDSIASNNYTHVMEWLTKWLWTSHGQSFCVSFDLKLKQVSAMYLNHLKASQQHFINISDAMWTWDELLLAAADNRKEDIVDPGESEFGKAKGDLSPDWNLNWLLQRKKAVDLLRYAPVPYKYDNLSGSASDLKDSASMAEVIERAWAGRISHTGYHDPDLPFTRVDLSEYIRRFNCSITFAHKIYATLPTGIDPNRQRYIMLNVTGIDGTDDSFASTSPISLGVNVLAADNNGVFEFDPDEFYEIIPPMPSLNNPSIAGWQSTVCTAFADYTDKFHFKPD